MSGAPSDLPPRRKTGLGRGLSALLEDHGRARGASAPAPGGVGGGDGAADGPPVEIELGAITALPDQPRRHFDPDAMDELIASVRERGVLQPILVRRAPGGGQGYQLIAGERRWRAATAAGLKRIPALVRELDDAATYEIALIENVQRADLSAIEEARGYARLQADFGHAPDMIARMIGKSRAHVANLMRLLQLPAPVQSLVETGALGMGHARALIGHADAEGIAARAVAEQLSVRRVEALVKGGHGGTRARKAKAEPDADPAGADAGQHQTGEADGDIQALERHLGDLLGLGVAIAVTGEGKGTLRLEYTSFEQLDMLCQRLTGGAV